VTTASAAMMAMARMLLMVGPLGWLGCCPFGGSFEDPRQVMRRRERLLETSRPWLELGWFVAGAGENQDVVSETSP
jgi:hypothetical protein